MKKTTKLRKNEAGAKSEFESVFARLRELLRKHSDTLTVTADAPGHFGLGGSAGPAAIRAWGGKVKQQVLPVAWVVIEKAYVSCHLMGIYVNAGMKDGMSKELKSRMQGKCCFNFKVVDEDLFKEFDRLTAQSIAGFRKAGFVAKGDED